MFEELNDESKLVIFSFLSATDRTKTRLVSRGMKEIADELKYWKFPNIWPGFFSAQRVELLAAQNLDRFGIEELAQTIEERLKEINQKVDIVKINIFSFKSFLAIICSFSAKYKELLISLLNPLEIENYLSDHDLVKFFSRVNKIAELDMLKYFHETIKNKIDSGPMLMTALQYTIDQEEFLSLFTLAELCNLLNDHEIRHSVNYGIVFSKMLYMTALKEINDLLNNNSNIYPFEKLIKLREEIEKSSCFDMFFISNFVKKTGLTEAEIVTITKSQYMRDILASGKLFPVEEIDETPRTVFNP